MTQLLLLEFGHTYLAERCISSDAIADETWEMSRLLEDAEKESGVVKCVIGVLQGTLKPLWG